MDAGKETTTTENGKLTLTIKVDSEVISSKIDESIESNTTGEDNIIQVGCQELTLPIFFSGVNIL